MLKRIPKFGENTNKYLSVFCVLQNLNSHLLLVGLAFKEILNQPWRVTHHSISRLVTDRFPEVAAADAKLSWSMVWVSF